MSVNPMSGCSIEDFRIHQVWEPHNIYLIYLEYIVIIVGFVLNCVLALAIKKTALLNQVTKVLTLNQFVGLLGYMPTRIPILINRLFNNELYTDTQRQVLNVIHDLSFQTHYVGVFIVALAITLETLYPTLEKPKFQGVFCGVMLVGTWGLAAFVQFKDRSSSGLLPVWAFYALSLCFSVWAFNRTLKASVNSYQMDYVGNVRTKTKLSIRIRSIQMLSKINVITAIRMSVAALLLWLCLSFFPQRCMYREGLLSAQFHDIWFEFIDIVIPLYLFLTERTLRNVLQAGKVKDASLRNAVGESLIMRNKGDDYFQRLSVQWATPVASKR